MMATIAVGIGRLSGSLTVPSMAATPEPDCAATGEPMATNSINSIHVIAREITSEAQRVITRPLRCFNQIRMCQSNESRMVLHGGNGRARGRAGHRCRQHAG